MEILKQFESWASSLEAKDLSPSSLREYKRDVKQFLDWLVSPKGGDCAYTTAHSIGMTTARQYRESLMKSHKASTVNRRIQSIAAFLSYLDLSDKENPFRNLKQVKIVRTAPKSITRSESNRIFMCADSMKKKDGGVALAVIALLRHAGLRVGELVALKMSDIEVKDKSGNVFIRNGKGLKARAVPLNLDAREGLKHWLGARKGVLEKIEKRFFAKKQDVPDWVHSDYVFIGQRGVLSTRGIHFMVRRLGELTKVEGTLHPHRLRHTFARAALDPKGYLLNREAVPLPALRKMLGHSRIETTSIYAEFGHDDHARFLEEKE